MSSLKRVVIVDFNHMAHIYMNSPHRLSTRKIVNGEEKRIDTTIQNGAIKAIYRWSNRGVNPTAVCFDSPVPARKVYFSKEFNMPLNTDKEYKGGRKYMPDSMREAIEMTQDILIKSGVSCYKAHNYEADDLIFACIETAKREYPDLPIDVITNDADLIPLVDDRVSVFLRSRKTTYAESKDIEKLHYVQITPRNYEEIVEDLSAFKKFYIPYNTVLFHKLVRGDSSDKIAGIKKSFPPKVYNNLIENLGDHGIDLSNLFRYGKCIKKYYSKSTGEEVTKDWDRSDLEIRYEDPEELLDMIDSICWYIEDEETLSYIKKKYKGMNLNQAYLGYGELSRKPAEVRKMVGFNEFTLDEMTRDRLDICLSH